MALSAYPDQLAQFMNEHIALEYEVSQTYNILASILDHPGVAYPGYAKFFRAEALEEIKHAQDITAYHHKRGAVVNFTHQHQTIQAQDPIAALEYALDLEKRVLESFLRMNAIADMQTQTFLQNYMEIQTNSIAEYQAMLTKAQRVGHDGLELLDSKFL